MIMMLNDWAQYGPKACETLAPASAYKPLYQALVCGTVLPSSEPQRLLLDTGLIHLMVVSGAHLAFLDRLASRLPAWARMLILAFYSWFTGFGAPIVRAFTQRCLLPFTRIRGFSHLQTDLLATFIILAAHPQWLTSRSFLMSWMCSLALSVPFGFLTLRCFAFLYPFAPTAPISLFWNTVITPVVGNFLFPLCLVSFAIHAVSPLTDLFWQLFLKILQWGPKAPPENWFLTTSSIFWLPLFFHILLIFGEVRWRRALAFSQSF